MQLTKERLYVRDFKRAKCFQQDRTDFARRFIRFRRSV